MYNSVCLWIASRLPQVPFLKPLTQQGWILIMDDTQKIERTLHTYFDCMFESSAEKAHAAFHPDARITGYMQGKLLQMSVSEFADSVAGQQPSAKSKGDTPRLDILSVDIAGETASARVRDDYLGLTFVDTLSLLKTDNEWQIYNKLFHVEGPA